MLHLFFQSIIEDSFFHRFESGDDAVFFEKSIFCLIKARNIKSRLEEMERGNIQLYVLEDDLKTRGFDQTDLVLGIDLINYADVVKLTEKTNQIVTWN